MVILVIYGGRSIALVAMLDNVIHLPIVIGILDDVSKAELQTEDR
jgi:hypothetical protein